MRYVFLLEYDGTDFCGWQRQPGKRSVQETLEKAAEKVFAAPVRITASGRTDAGVHARGQVAQCDAETGIPAEKLAVCFNRLLPPDVKVLKSAQAPEGFDVTRGAKRKTYLYSAYFAPCDLPLKERYAARLEREPDLEKMREAAALLLGEHDFAAFRSAGFSSKTSERTIFSVEIDRKEEPDCVFFGIAVTGNGFLYNMVRILAGELFAIGCGKPEGITRAFEKKERSALARTMPARGLCLVNVEYTAPLFGAEKKE